MYLFYLWPLERAWKKDVSIYACKIAKVEDSGEQVWDRGRQSWLSSGRQIRHAGNKEMYLQSPDSTLQVPVIYEHLERKGLTRLMRAIPK